VSAVSNSSRITQPTSPLPLTTTTKKDTSLGDNDNDVENTHNTDDAIPQSPGVIMHTAAHVVVEEEATTINRKEEDKEEKNDNNNSSNNTRVVVGNLTQEIKSSSDPELTSAASAAVSASAA